MIDTLVTVALSMVYICWWLVPVIAFAALAVWLLDRGQPKDEWPFKFEPPFNMDEESP